MKDYAHKLIEETQRAWSVASKARSAGLDPEEVVEIALAKDVYERVEGLVGPPGVAERLRQLGAKDREEACALIAKEIMEGKFGEASLEKRLKQAVRTGLALFTEGVVSAPIEGISQVRIKQNPDNSRYVAVYFAGPIRGAGGTGQAFALLLADYCRKLAGLADYRPIEDEVERYVEEVGLYAVRTRAGQYVPTEEETKHVVRSCPVCINGEPTEDYEVNIYKNISSVETNRVRSGVCLVISEGVCLKAAKVLKLAKKLGLDWTWAEKLVKVSKKTEVQSLQPNEKYMDEIVAGRPIFSYPLHVGGFRLRYGRTRFTGIQAKAVHPATMIMLEEYPAFGTQVKTERPGKGSITTPCEAIEGPTVLLDDGEVRTIQTIEEAKAVKNRVQKILFVGDLLVSFGDFLKSNHVLLPGAYVEEYYQKLLRSKGVNKTLEELRTMEFEEAYQLSKQTGLPLPPKYSFYWEALSVDELKALREGLALKGRIIKEWFDAKKVFVEGTEEKPLLEKAGVPHWIEDGNVVFEKNVGLALWQSMGLSNANDMQTTASTVIEYLNSWSAVPIKNKAGVFIGTSMGRPEKSRERKMQPPVHVLFPVGLWGGKMRDAVKAAREEHIEVELETRFCANCQKKTWAFKCPQCNCRTTLVNQCTRCGKLTQKECCGPTVRYEKKRFSMKGLLGEAAEKVKFRPLQLKGVIGLISAGKTPENIAKGVLRAKHEVSVFRDGTCRYDATEIPCTHFTPKDIGISVEKARALLGYERDHEGKPIEEENQLLELYPQDVILSENAAEYLLRVAAFLDDELVYIYGMSPYYNAKKPEDLIGQQVICLAPHTSAGITARIIGFTPVQGIIAHPYLHCATRRNCIAPDTLLYYENDEKIHVMPIEETYHKYEAKYGSRREGHQTDIVSLPPNLVKTYGTDKEGRFERKNTSAIMRRYYEGQLLKITGENRQEITVTPEHRLWVFRDNALQEREACELKVGDSICSIGRLQTTGHVEGLDLITVFEDDSEADGITVRTSKEYCKEAAKTLGGWGQAKEKLGIGNRELSNFFHRAPHGIPIKIYSKLVGLTGKRYEHERLGFKRNFGEVNGIIQPTKEFFKLLGYYLSEGHCWISKTKSKESYHVGIAASRKEVRDDVKKCIQKALGITPYEYKTLSVTVTNKIVYKLFTEKLKLGRTAREKDIPDFCLAQATEGICALLSGLFQGDGYIDDKEIKYTTVSERLASKIFFLLTRLGISPTFKLEKDKKITSGLVFEKYAAKGRQPPSTTLHYVCAYSTDRTVLASALELLGKKKEKLMSIKIRSGRRLIRNYNDARLVKIKSITSVPYEGFVYDVELEKGLDKIFACGKGLIASHNCDGDELGLMLLMDGLLNFSKHFLPQSRGGQMDASLVLTTALNPSEVDDEVHAMECVYDYPLSLYLAAEQFASPSEVKIDIVADRLGTDKQFEGFGFTHPASLTGPYRTTYVKFKNMEEKVEDEMRLMRKIRAVDVADAAERIIVNHFFPDLYGNLRSFSKQVFRCVDCNVKYRRVPLVGKCRKCGGKLLLTISKGGIEKYLELSKKMVDEFNLPNYLRQRLMLLEKEIQSIFENEPTKQFSLTQYL